jgi:hypothetical protein
VSETYIFGSEEAFLAKACEIVKDTFWHREPTPGWTNFFDEESESLRFRRAEACIKAYKQGDFKKSWELFHNSIDQEDQISHEGDFFHYGNDLVEVEISEPGALFEYVKDPIIRDYLINGSQDSDTHAEVLAATKKALADDRDDDDVSVDVFLDRAFAYKAASDSFNLDGDLWKTHQQLIKFWSA